jgi:hypothetical protein
VNWEAYDVQHVMSTMWCLTCMTVPAAGGSVKKSSTKGLFEM